MIARPCPSRQRVNHALGPAARAAYRAFREAEQTEAELASENWHLRYAEYDPENAREDLANATNAYETDRAQAHLTKAEAEAAAWASDQQAAAAEYTEWFTPDRRAKVWRAIDVVFGAYGTAFAEDEDGGDGG